MPTAANGEPETTLAREVDRGGNVRIVDAIRDRRLTEDGYRVLRFWNNDVLGNTDGVLMMIQAELSK